MDRTPARLSSGKCSDADKDPKQDASTTSPVNELETNRSHNWSIPKLDISKVYSKGYFDFTRDFSIKTSEHTMTVKSSHESLYLLSKESIIRHRKKYRFLHIGLVQVAAKPLRRRGSGSSILLCLRDSRHLNFQNSLLAVAESNLENGPVYFNCYPDFSVDLSDPHILKSLTLNIQTKNIEFLENSKSLALIYRVYYKVMSATINPKALKSSPIGETLLYEANFQHSNAFIPKRIAWDQVTTSSSWNLPPEETDRVQTPQVFMMKQEGSVIRFSRSTRPSTS